MTTPTGPPLVGRDHVLAALDNAAGAAASGCGGQVVVAGHPGMGKSRLLAEFAARTTARGFAVLRGAGTDDAGAPALRPWTTVLRSAAAGRDAGTLRTVWGTAAVPGFRLLPELAAPDGPPGADPDTARFQLFEAVAVALAAEAQAGPVAVLLDDLHWADGASIDLLRFVARDAPAHRLLLVGAYRPGASVTGPLDDLPAERVTLAGLDGRAVADLLAAALGSPAAEGTAEAVRQRTDGNPLFVREFAALVRSEGLGAVARSLPQGVRAVIARRLETLGASAASTLAVAAVLGTEIEVGLVSRVSGHSSDEVLTGVDAAVRAGLVEPSPHPHRFTFTHALIRETAYDSLRLTERAELHHRAAAALADAARLGEVADHLLRAGPADAIASEAACAAAERAAEQSLASLAFEDAARLYGAAVHVLGITDPARRLRLLLARGGALLQAGDVAAARPDFSAAAALARELHDPRSLARAALGFAAGLGGFEVRLLDPIQAEFLSAALAGLPADDPLRPWLLARLSVALSYLAPDARRAALAEEAVDAARKAGDGAALAQALAARCDAIAGPDHVATRLAHAGEIVALGESAGDLPTELLGRRLRVVALAELGRADELTGEVAAFARAAETLGQPLYSWYVPLWRGMNALARGEIAAAEAFSSEAAQIGARADSRNAAILTVVQRAWILSAADRRADAVALVLESFGELPELAPGTYVTALDLIDFGGPVPARVRAALDDLATVVAALPRDAEWLPMLAQFAMRVLTDRHVRAASALLPCLEPYADLFAIEGIGAASNGSIARYLGGLAHLVGDHDRAAEWFETALLANERAGALLQLIETQRDFADLLDGRGDAERARALRADADRTASRLGGTAPTVVPKVGEPDCFRREGAYWTLRYRGITATVRDVKGLRDLARLLTQPGREMHVLDLASPGGAARTAEAPDGAPGDLGEVLDATGRAAFRARLVQLEAAESDAEAAGDGDTAARARAEREELVDALSAAYGIDGRPRRTGDPAERARSAVTWRIRDALGRIENAHPELGRHLRNAVRTGTYCVYAPEDAPAWEL